MHILDKDSEGFFMYQSRRGEHKMVVEENLEENPIFG